MKRWSVSLIFEKYEYVHSGANVTLQKTITSTAVRLVTAATEEAAFGVAYYDAVKVNKGKVLFTHAVILIPPIKRKTKIKKEDE